MKKLIDAPVENSLKQKRVETPPAAAERKE
jgi:hypothetical protein